MNLKIISYIIPILFYIFLYIIFASDLENSVTTTIFQIIYDVYFWLGILIIIIFVRFLFFILKFLFTIFLFTIKAITLLPLKYIFKIIYYIFIWPVLRFFSAIGSGDVTLWKPNNDIKVSENKTVNRHRTWVIQTWEGTGWIDRSFSSNNNPNYISMEIDRIQKMNIGKRVRAIYKDTGQILDQT